MGKYASHDEFGARAPVSYREDTTSESYLEGMSRIAPAGMRPKASRGRRFEEKTDFQASARWHRNYDLAMFGGSDIEALDYGSRQLGLEARIAAARGTGGKR